MSQLAIIIILVSLLLSAFFSGMEIAFLQSNKLKIELDNKKGYLSARILSSFIKKQGFFITTLLLGNNIALVIYGIYAGELIINLFFPQYYNASSIPVWIILIQTIISTLCILVTAEFLPKTIFRINPNRVLNICAIPLQIIYIILWPFTKFIMFISNFFLKLFNRDAESEELSFGKVDLENYLVESQNHATIDPEELEQEVQIFHNALNFSNIKARDCLVPRTEIMAHEINDDIESLKVSFIKTSYSKILIYRDNIDNIIGYVHSFEMLKQPDSIKSILLPISIVPETVTAEKLLQQLISQNRSVAVVVDEFGGTAGIVTVEDVVEEIFGEIEDEHDSDDLLKEKISDTEYVFSARTEIDYLNQEYQLNLPESDEYETLAGYIINQTENLPNKGELIQLNGLTFIIEKASDTRIEEVRILLSDDD